MNRPLISVVMPVYNGDRFLMEAVDSILTQSFGDFEFIIVDDGSTDKTAEILRNYKDTRIKLLKHDRNLGISSSLNDGIAAAQTNYILRMDADDISLPDRLKRQFEFMENNPDIDISGAWMRAIEDPLLIFRTKINDMDLKTELLFRNCFLHPTIIFRKSSLKKYNLLYDGKYNGCEDFALWGKCSISNLRFRNIPKIVLRYRLKQDFKAKYPKRNDLEKEILRTYHQGYLNDNYLYNNFVKNCPDNTFKDYLFLLFTMPKFIKESKTNNKINVNIILEELFRKPRTEIDKVERKIIRTLSKLLNPR